MKEPAAAKDRVEFAPWPYFDDEMIDVVARVLRSGRVNYWTGSEGRSFEQEYADHVGCKHAIAVANGTLALELALYALDVRPGDEVVVPCRTFIATASSVVARGAVPVVADVDADSQTITAETVKSVITPRTKAIIAVHLAGWPCEMDALVELARSLGIAVVEDCAQAHGAQYKGRVVGSIGDIGAYSFCQDKILTTGGEGGVVVTNRSDLWDRAWRYKDHGKRPEAFYQPRPPSNQFRWLHDDFGSNFRMTEVQAAIGRVMLRRLPQWSETRRRHAARLAECCRRCPALRTPQPPPWVKHAYYKFYSFVQPERLAQGWDRGRIRNELRARGIPCSSGSCSEIYLERAFPPPWRPKERFRVGQALGETSLMFLVHPTLTDENVRVTCAAVREVMGLATRTIVQTGLRRSA